MHEYGMCDGVVEAVLSRAAGRWVKVVTLRIGVRHAVVEEIFREAFAHCAEGTLAEGAHLVILKIPMDAECRRCGHRFHTTDVLAACPRCDEPMVAIGGGDELMLQSLEYDLDKAAAPRLQTGHVH